MIFTEGMGGTQGFSKLNGLFDPASEDAHDHSGVEGKGKKISAVNVTNEESGNLAAGTVASQLVTIDSRVGMGTGMKNKIINGNFDIWQRGITFGANENTADCWRNDALGSSVSISRQTFTPGQTDVKGEPKFFHRAIVASVLGASNYVFLSHRIEDVRTLSGRNATLSFYAKADSNKNICVELVQSFGAGASSPVIISGVQLNLTANWAKHVITFPIPSIVGKTINDASGCYLAMQMFLEAGTSLNSRTFSLGQQSGTFDIAQVQLEEGNIATTFEQRHYQQELALCQRYLPVALNGLGYSCAGMAYSATLALCLYPFKVTPRVVPTGIIASTPGNFVALNYTAANLTCTSISFNGGTTLEVGAINVAVASGFTAGNTTLLNGSVAPSKILFTGCEL